MATREMSDELKALKDEVDRWRRERRKRTRIPEHLWAGAVRVAQTDGLWATSRATRFHYESLKRRTATAPPRPRVALTRIAAEGPVRRRVNGAAHAEPAAFVEVPMGTIGAAPRTVVELMGQGGDRIRIETAGGVDLAGLVRSFFDREAR